MTAPPSLKALGAGRGETLAGAAAGVTGAEGGATFCTALFRLDPILPSIPLLGAAGFMLEPSFEAIAPAMPRGDGFGEEAFSPARPPVASFTGSARNWPFAEVLKLQPF
jgi:hypothetical protein